jgi:hypothetical protein
MTRENTTDPRRVAILTGFLGAGTRGSQPHLKANTTSGPVLNDFGSINIGANLANIGRAYSASFIASSRA